MNYPVSELKRKPKEGDECVCGAPYEDGEWRSHFLNRSHDGLHKPWRFGTLEQCLEAEMAREKGGR